MFEDMLRELSHLQQLVQEMKEENRELHQRLADLREGRGVFVKIDDRRMALDVSTITPSSPVPVVAHMRR